MISKKARFFIFIVALSCTRAYAEKGTIEFDNQTGLHDDQLAFIFYGCKAEGDPNLAMSESCVSRYVSFCRKIDLREKRLSFAELSRIPSTAYLAGPISAVITAIPEYLHAYKIKKFSVILATLPANLRLYGKIDNDEVRDLPITPDTTYTIRIADPDKKHKKPYFTLTTSPVKANVCCVR